MRKSGYAVVEYVGDCPVPNQERWGAMYSRKNEALVAAQVIYEQNCHKRGADYYVLVQKAEQNGTTTIVDGEIAVVYEGTLYHGHDMAKILSWFD